MYRRLNRTGYTLIETLICVVLGAFALLAVALSLDSGVFLSSDNRYHLYSLNALREELETLRRTNYDTIVSYGSSSTFTNAQMTKLPSGAGTRLVASSFGSDIKKLTLQVTWTSRRGTTMTEKVTTYVTRKGLNGS